MYDCIKGQVMLSAAALGIEVLSRFLSPADESQRRCCHKHGTNLPLLCGWKMKDFHKLSGLRVMKGIGQCIEQMMTTELCYAINTVVRQILVQLLLNRSVQVVISKSKQ